jgi:hypothetical protein
MRGDFSRVTFRQDSGFSRVLFQQGRNLLDADFNEQSSIQRAQLRELAERAIDWWGKPSSDFKITDAETVPAATPPSLDIQVQGSYYVGGMLADFGKMPKRTVARPQKGEYLLLFLDFHEKTVFPEAEPDLLEPALDPRDTALRLSPVWVLQVLRTTTKPPVPASQKDFRDGLVAAGRGRPGTGQLAARVYGQSDPQANRCDPLAADQYQGVENQLYRVEIHDAAAVDTGGKMTTPATFKWSRDNASVVFAVRSYAADPGQQSLKVQLGQPALDETWALQRGNWVELLRAHPPAATGDADPFPAPSALLSVSDVDPASGTVTLAVPDGFTTPTKDDYPLLLRWDQTSSAGSTGGIPVTPLTTDPKHPAWLPLEAGVQVYFVANDQSALRPGDYWLIPARAASQDVIWPRDDSTHDPIPQPPHGPEHTYAPLAYLDGGEADTGPLTVHLFPWDKDPGPDQSSLSWNVTRLVLNAASPVKDDDPPYTPGADPGLKVLDDLKDPSAPIAMSYSLRQMLVIANSDPVTDPPPKWPDLLESLRRFHLESRGPLVKMIHDRVDPILVASKVKDVLKLPSSEAKTPAFVAGKIGPDDIKGPAIAEPLKSSLNRLTLTTVAAIVKAAKSATAMVGAVLDDLAGAGVTLTDPQKAQLTEQVTGLWKAAACVDHYFKAWPYRTIDGKDWP